MICGKHQLLLFMLIASMHHHDVTYSCVTAVLKQNIGNGSGFFAIYI